MDKKPAGVGNAIKRVKDAEVVIASGDRFLMIPHGTEGMKKLILRGLNALGTTTAKGSGPKQYAPAENEPCLHTVRVTLQSGEFAGHFAFQVGGIGRGYTALINPFEMCTPEQEEIASYPENSCKLCFNENGYTATLTSPEGAEQVVVGSADEMAALIVGLKIIDCVPGDGGKGQYEVWQTACRPYALADMQKCYQGLITGKFYQNAHDAERMMETMRDRYLMEEERMTFEEGRKCAALFNKMVKYCEKFGLRLTGLV